ncbi:MAG: hypothetical protein FWH27_01015 [Planctomycetaceae bacterium]|nr:hypothetical protein [Planctomycetaceae bacterium]
MNFERSDFIRVVKRLTEASGYLDLEMPQQALETLRGIRIPGPFEAQIAFLRGKALQQAKQFEDAAVCLAVAAKSIPPEYKKMAFEYLSECVRESCNPPQLALLTFGVYRGAEPSPTFQRFMQ